MPSYSDIIANPDQALYYLFKGEPGVRKATHALSWPKPLYIFNWDQKSQFGLIPIKLWNLDPKEIFTDNYSDWDTAKKKIQEFQVRCPYKTLVFKTITSLGDCVNQQTLKVKYGTTNQSGQEAGKRIGGIAVNTIEDFNAETAAFQELIKMTKDIKQHFKCNIILIAHVIQVDHKSPTGVTTFSRSLVTGGKKIAAKIPSQCDEVYHFNVDKLGGNYEVLTSHSGDDYARTTLPLDNRITLGEKPLYTTHILPAIQKLHEQQQNNPKATF